MRYAHQVFHGGEATRRGSESPVSFQIPSLLAARTRNRYLPGSGFV